MIEGTIYGGEKVFLFVNKVTWLINVMNDHAIPQDLSIKPPPTPSMRPSCGPFRVKDEHLNVCLEVLRQADPPAKWLIFSAVEAPKDAFHCYHQIIKFTPYSVSYSYRDIASKNKKEGNSLFYFGSKWFVYFFKAYVSRHSEMRV